MCGSLFMSVLLLLLHACLAHRDSPFAQERERERERERLERLERLERERERERELCVDLHTVLYMRFLTRARIVGRAHNP